MSEEFSDDSSPSECSSETATALQHQTMLRRSASAADFLSSSSSVVNLCDAHGLSRQLMDSVRQSLLEQQIWLEQRKQMRRSTDANPYGTVMDEVDLHLGPAAKLPPVHSTGNLFYF